MRITDAAAYQASMTSDVNYWGTDPTRAGSDTKEKGC